MNGTLYGNTSNHVQKYHHAEETRYPNTSQIHFKAQKLSVFFSPHTCFLPLTEIIRHIITDPEPSEPWWLPFTLPFLIGAITEANEATDYFIPFNISPEAHWVLQPLFFISHSIISFAQTRSMTFSRDI